MNKKDLKLFLIGFGLNIIENLVLLYYNGVELGKNTIIGASIFGLCLVLLNKVIGEKNE